MTLGEKIRADRKRIGLTQEQLADKLCVSRQAIQKWESDNGIPSIENLKAIAQLFEVSIDSLVADEEAPIENGMPEASKDGAESEELRQEVVSCPQCGTENIATANFCKLCGYCLSESEETECEPVPPEKAPTEEKKVSAAQWFKKNLKLIIPLAVFLVVVIVICALIPTFISLGKKKNQLSGTYYVYEEGEYDKSGSIAFEDQTWEMKGAFESEEISVSGTYKKTDDEIIFYYVGNEMFRGTIKDDVLTLKNSSGETAVLCQEGHKHNFDEWKTSEPGCSRDGFSYHTCYCGFEETRVLPATGNHTLGAYTAEKKATCSVDGNVGYYRCSVCQKYFSDGAGTNEIYSLIIPATGHTEGEWKVIREATCGEEGTKTLSCTVCKTQLKSSVIEATGAHEWKQGACNVCEATQVNYELSSDGKYYIVTGLSDAAKNCKEIEILASYQGLPVSEIGDEAFYECSELSSVIIPESVTWIGSEAFYRCSGLRSIKIPNASIWREAFAGCTGLTSVKMGSGVGTIGKNAFNSCSALQSIVIPNGVTEIMDYAFNYCRELTSVTIGSGVEEIGVSVFSSCEKLTDIYYVGTAKEWMNINKHEFKWSWTVSEFWDSGMGDYTIHYKDEEIS